MKKTFIVKLYFRNALHIGASNPGIGIEGTEQQIIHSDTLWSALCNNWAIAEKAGKISFDDFLKSFETGNPLFRISSAFPITGSNEYWLPKPLSVPFAFSESNPQPSDSDKTAYAKDIKSKQFINLSDFVSWIGFDKTADSLQMKEIADKNYRPGKIADILRPHNTLDRISFASQIYHSGTSYFDPEKRSGFYFLLQTDENKSEEVQSAVRHILEIIRETGGIGGNRSIGLGAINGEPEILTFDEIGTTKDDWKALNLDRDITEQENAYCLLSLYHPNAVVNNGWHKTALAYQLILRKGWTGSLSVSQQVKRKTVYMFSEGSVFQNKPDGHLADLTPDSDKTPQWKGCHQIYRYGYGLSVPVKIHMGDYNVHQQNC